MAGYDLHKKAAGIVDDAGGRLVGRTRLQKVAYLLQLVGFSKDFPFEYRHFGPFSEELAEAMEIASGLHLVREEEKKTDWGGWYSVYVTEPLARQPSDRSRFVAAAAELGAIELELAATAAFLYANEGIGQDRPGDPWQETARRKPEKAGEDRLRQAKAAYKMLQEIRTPLPLPPIV